MHITGETTDEGMIKDSRKSGCNYAKERMF